MRMEDVFIQALEPESQAAEVVALLDEGSTGDLGRGEVFQARGGRGELMDAVEGEE